VWLRKICLFCLIAIGLSACVSGPHLTDITIRLVPAKKINEGVLLPVDILTVDSSLSATALGIGPDNWFGEDVRDRLTDDEIKRLAISGGNTKSVSLKVPENIHKVIIFADFENNSDRVGQQIIIAPEKLRFLPKYKININEDQMELVR